MVIVIKHLASIYSITADLNRECKDDVLRKAYRNLSLKAHPDRGGKEEDQKSLNGAYEAAKDHSTIANAV